MSETGQGAGTVFASPLAGRWYSGSRDTLQEEVNSCLRGAEGPRLESPRALIVPHAGYRYSGPVAGYAYRQLEHRPVTRVVVLGPSHRVSLANSASVPDFARFATPLGEVPLDTVFIAALRQSPLFQSVPMVDEEEHSVQIQLPFLQQTLGAFSIVPIVVGQLDEAAVHKMAGTLRGLVDDGTVVVVSSDFTHYGRSYGYVPFTDDVTNSLRKLDMTAWRCIEQKDLKAFQAHLDRTGDTICGHDPISVLLAMLPKDMTPHLLKYDTSASITGDTANSVSYLAIAFTGQWTKESPSQTLTPEDKAALLKLARAALETRVRTGAKPSVEALGIPISDAMRWKMGAFVTLHENGQLRGCIGEIIPHRELYLAVFERAMDAGLRDSRFSPVTAEDLPHLEYEISALTEPVPVASYHDIVLGRHGMVLNKRGRSAVFLPQVAPEQGWDIPETLTHLAMKAGLAPDDWKEGAEFTVFEAIVFSEKEFKAI